MGKMGPRNFFNPWNKIMDCGIEIWVAQHHGSHEVETYLMDVYRHRNVLCITSDNTSLMLLHNLLPKKKVEEIDSQKDGDDEASRNKRYAALFPWIEGLFYDICHPYEQQMRKGIPRYAPLVLIDRQFYIDIPYLHKLVLHRASVAPLTGRAYEVAEYLFDNVSMWHGALKESLVNKSSFYGMDYARTMKYFEEISPDLQSLLGKKPKKLEAQVAVDPSKKIIIILSHEEFVVLRSELINANDAGKKLGISHSTVKKRGQAGHIQMYIHASSKKNYFKRSDIESYEKSVCKELEEVMHES